MINAKQTIYFTSDGNKLSANLYLPQEATEGVLILHGGGKSSKDRFIVLQEFLASHDIASFAFNFRGVGDSEGTFENGSLDNRLDDAIDALHEFSKYIDTNRIYVIGSSMGGHVAAKLIEKEPHIPGLMLLYAAAYGKDAEDKKLNNAFTKEIHKDHNWDNSPAFSALENYAGNVLVVYGEHDAVIPQDVQQTYKKLIANKGTFLLLPHASHLLLSPQSKQEKQATEQAYAAILNFVESGK